MPTQTHTQAAQIRATTNPDSASAIDLHHTAALVSLGTARRSTTPTSNQPPTPTNDLDDEPDLDKPDDFNPSGDDPSDDGPGHDRLGDDLDNDEDPLPEDDIEPGESTVTDTSSNEPEQLDRGFTSGILLNLFSQSLASLGTPIQPIPLPLFPTHPPTPLNTMSGSSSKAPVGNATKATELKIGAPSDFDGNQKNAMSWLYSVQTYLLVNEELYDTDTKKVVYALSYMKKDVAHSWAATFQKTSLEKNPPSFSTFANFIKDFKASFTSTDATGTAIAKLRILKQKDSFFSQGLKPFIANRIHMMETTPTKITEWYTQAQKFDAKWRKVNETFGRKEKKMFHPRNSFAEEKDPNAMDVDGVRLSKEERDCHIKEGRCFGCGNKGHLSRECPDKGKAPQKKVKKIRKIVEVEESDDDEKVAGPSIALVNIARALGKDF
ncbi:hypothetical protein M404DRAFT_25039 [Pisolithus tinctorius Marx 270]|uniref:CCHC-type domain-containing protein n=1 Tax=Pisolithus tinctorius Marx 270 TaxID=870435 RepID=A0A0C3PCF8_PISTI|nr:hypothetical protein M404DRAFT_25039 [Pisolithus tinctorius Marx 270]